MSSDAKITFDPTENESVGDKLGYEKDSKERLPWEHYLSQYRDADPKEIATRLGISYNEEEKYFTLKFLGTVYQISWPDFEVSHKEDDMGFYPLETMVYARTLTIRFLLNGACAQGTGKFKLTGKCHGVRCISVSLMAAALNVWHFPMETVLKTFRQSWNICIVN